MRKELEFRIERPEWWVDGMADWWTVTD